jgi:TRAP-type C4-dicarboxylate transport system substrate-binding protein
MKSPVYSRADLSRTVALVVALCLAAASTSAVAREFRAADTQSEDYPTVQALQYMGRLIAESSSGLLQIRVFHYSVRPVRSLADMKGSRLRVQQSALVSDMNRALGAEPVELPYGQVLTGPATKLNDGAENNWPSFVTTDHYKYAGFYTLTEHTMSLEMLVMSQKAWQSLSAEDQTIFRDAAIKSSQFVRAKWKDLEERSRQKAKAAGVTIVTEIDRKPFEDAMAGIYAKAQADPAAAALIERIRKVE